MEALETIWLSPNKYRSNEPSCFWSESQRTDYDIEYIRKDAFIEKACEYFAPHIKDNSGGYDRAFVLENFKKYLGK